MAFLAACRVELPGPEYASLGEFINRHHLCMLPIVVPQEINPNRQDIDFPLGGFQYAVRDSLRERSICAHSKRGKVG
jgi:hypothetical protein